MNTSVAHFDCLLCLEDAPRHLFQALFTLIVLVGVAGNCFVLAVIARERKLLQSSINLFLLNLAMADLCNLIFCSPDIAMVLMDRGWLLADWLCPVLRFVQEHSLYASVLIQSAIGVERFFAICSAYHVRRLSRQISTMLLVIVWAVAALFALPYPLYQKVIITRQFRLCIWTPMPFREMFKWAEFLMLYLVPLMMLTVLYTLMGRVLWGDSGQRLTDEQQQAAILRLRRSVVKMLIISMLLYFVFYSPIQGIFVVETLLKRRFLIDRSMRLTMNALSLSSSSVNPIVYIVCCRHFRLRFLEMITCGQEGAGEWMRRRSSHPQSFSLINRSKKKRSDRV